MKIWANMFGNSCSDVVKSLKGFTLESFNKCCQIEHAKINKRLNFNTGLALSPFKQLAPG